MAQRRREDWGGWRAADTGVFRAAIDWCQSSPPIQTIAAWAANGFRDNDGLRRRPTTDCVSGWDHLDAVISGRTSWTVLRKLAGRAVT